MKKNGKTVKTDTSEKPEKTPEKTEKGKTEKNGTGNGKTENRRDRENQDTGWIFRILKNSEKKNGKREPQDSGKRKKERESGRMRRTWTITITIIAFFLSVFMSLASDTLLNHSNLLVAFLILIFIILLGVAFDIVGVAVTVADERPFHSMASQKLRGAKSSLKLIRSASRVSNVCNDVIGDTCGIISGTSVAYIVIKTARLMDLGNTAILSVALSGLVAAATIGGKALGKEFAMAKSKDIILLMGKILAFFLERG